MIDVDILARRMFAAYNEAAGGLTWHAAAREAIAFVGDLVERHG